MSVAWFRRLAVATALCAYLQIALGGVVRVSGSGLGCPDWPLCHGRPYPPADLHAIIEYSHRAVGAITGILIIATVVSAWLLFRSRRPAVAWLATASLIGVVGEGILGGIVVAHELTPWLVLVHLGLAMIILGFLVAAGVMSMPESAGVADSRFRAWALAAVGSTYLLLLSGTTVVAREADEGCHSWPLCGSGFALDFSDANAFTMLHRGSVLVIGALLVYVLVMAMRRTPAMRFAAIATIAVLALQVAVGAGSALTDNTLFNGLHVALATLVWSGVVVTALLAWPRADRQVDHASYAVERRTA
jgi:heme A synthase